MDADVIGVPLRKRTCSPSGLGTVGPGVGVGVPNDMVGRGVAVAVGVDVGEIVIGRGVPVGSSVASPGEHADSKIAKPTAIAATLILVAEIRLC